MRRPKFIAAQARNASGPLGRLIAGIMARETRGDNLWAIETLAPKLGEHILDLGTGHGQSLGELASRVGASGSVIGVDPSKLMVKTARSRNRGLVARGLVSVILAPAEYLPLEAGTFDRAMAVHVIYFWPELGGPLRELARVLRPSGRLVLLFRSTEDPRTAHFPDDIYTFPRVEDVKSALLASGFTIESESPSVHGDRSTPVVIGASRN